MTDSILSPSNKWPRSTPNSSEDNAYFYFADEITEEPNTEWQIRDSTLDLSNSNPASSPPATSSLLNHLDATRQLLSFHWSLTFFSQVNKGEKLLD